MNFVEYFRLGLRHRRDPFFIKYLKGRRVLDIGSGRGEFLAQDPINFTGVDVDATLVTQCRERGMRAHCMSALSLEFPDASFDAVHASQLIEHFSPTDAVRFLAEAARVLHPGGIVFITTPGVRNVWNTFSHLRPYPPEAFRKLLNSDTENYIRENRLDLMVENAWGSRFYFKRKAMMFIFCLIDLLMPPKDPIGWTILLRKKGPDANDKGSV